MSEPFLGQIAIFGFNFAPRGFALCDGQILPINQNQALFSLLGTTYGGDGRTTFALPDLRGRVPIHFDFVAHRLGSNGGEETHTLSTTEMPAHKHAAMGSADAGTTRAPAGTVPAVEANGFAAIYGSSSGATLKADALTNAGSGQSHENMQPFLVLNFAIALQGLFPPRN